MLKPTLITSVLTGTFCAVFATVIDYVTDALTMSAVIGLAFCSGFLGSLVAQVVQRTRT